MPEVRKKLTIDVPSALVDLSRVFLRAGHELFLVGGAVRDAVLGLPPKDFDVATDATPDQVLELLKRIPAWKTDEVGRSFGVIRARLTDENGAVMGHEYEIATFRRDVGVGRRPDSVVFTSIEEDVKRRDLTLNALFYDVKRQEVVDLVGGLDDLANGLVRTVGNPNDRFAEDRLRVIRAVRFAARFGYEMHPETASSIRDNPSLGGVSPERVHDELVKSITTAKSVPRFLSMMDELGLWSHVLPGLKVSTRLDTLVSTRGIDTNNVAMALAMLLDSEPDVQNVYNKLVTLKHSADEALNVKLLLRFRHLDASTAHKLRRDFAASNLTLDELSQYFIQRGMPDRRLFEAFVRYVDARPVSGDLLLAEGYSGKALGGELFRRESELFRGLVNDA